MRQIYLILSLLIVCSCRGQNVNLTAKIGFETTGLIVPNDIQEFHIGNIHKNYITVLGLDKLMNLHRLELQLLTKDADLSFLNGIKLLENIAIYGSYIKNCDDLLGNKNIKYLYIKECEIYNSVIDLKNNTSLKYLGLVNSAIIDSQGSIGTIILKNIPNSLKYFDLSETINIKIDADFINSVKNIPKIILSESIFKKYSKLLEGYDNFFSDVSFKMNEEKIYKDIIVESPKFGFY